MKFLQATTRRKLLNTEGLHAGNWGGGAPPGTIEKTKAPSGNNILDTGTPMSRKWGYRDRAALPFGLYAINLFGLGRIYRWAGVNPWQSRVLIVLMIVISTDCFIFCLFARSPAIHNENRVTESRFVCPRKVGIFHMPIDRRDWSPPSEEILCFLRRSRNDPSLTIADRNRHDRSPVFGIFGLLREFGPSRNVSAFYLPKVSVVEKKNIFFTQQDCFDSQVQCERFRFPFIFHGIGYGEVIGNKYFLAGKSGDKRNNRSFGFDARHGLFNCCDCGGVRVDGPSLNLQQRATSDLSIDAGNIGNPLHLSKLLVHDPQLTTVNENSTDTNGHRNHLKNLLQQWRLVGSAIAGIFLMFWGWFNLRSGKGWGYWGWATGCILWGWSFHGWLWWWLNL
jgi:hypothetical protein